jgi:hypothetical protein
VIDYRLLVIDGGNSHFRDTEQGWEWLGEKGLSYVGLGISGGEEGRATARASPRGPHEAYQRLEPILGKIAAQASTGSCVTYIGSPVARPLDEPAGDLCGELDPLPVEANHGRGPGGGLSVRKQERLAARGGHQRIQPPAYQPRSRVTEQLFGLPIDEEDAARLVRDHQGDGGVLHQKLVARVAQRSILPSTFPALYGREAGPSVPLVRGLPCPLFRGPGGRSDEDCDQPG